MKELIFFSNNKNKLNEIEIFFRELKINIFSPKDFGINLEPRENGRSFADNAKIKSRFGYNKIKIPCFADDSGICIEALNWKPNVLSKNFINSFKNKKDCFNYILKKVKKSGKANAYFQTSVCLTLGHSYHILFEGKVYGEISKNIMGLGGFGFDPIFIPHGSEKTFGEMSLKQKNLYSHRSVAIKKLINFITI